ncbi:hypothetical protein PBI_BUTTERS_23 [Mycobacterium phage Butters]|uniref:Uncharacterized protein n=5 Tax=Charlievirus TaxID=1623280 RepID=A0A142ULR9_9CAUD|nr:hypothetical protein K768_gp23 [Mycobacterium phage Butters]YP_009304930.1 hypothetical protein BJD70_gp22 [Mycobacterium phage Panchino]YP_009595713.1 hypothetical protein FDG99_gp22 [Mycobacterium phage SkinnyPete]YP_010052026.1 hypothetical protein KD930_gp23 [Mycobacterium phage Kevin1]AXC38534.1 hypothetical protein SEA_RUBEELU_23 [Mycobacterium phage Rubeelu]WAW19109.1 hypothetical protein BIB10_23 [Mycobacterium phage BIB10]WAW19171.1 hypothetical protein BIB9_23 [Mycobacterium phag
MELLFVPCPLCGFDVAVPLLSEGDHMRAPDLLPNMNSHVISVHEMDVSGM